MPRGRIPYHQTNEHGERVKICVDCKESLTMEHYSINKKGHPQARCKKCNPVFCRQSDLARKYGISVEDYRFMVENQNNTCEICGGVNTDGRPLFVDHCHKSGKVRSLLCHSCNAGIGCFKDDESLLEKAINYLKFHKVKTAEENNERRSSRKHSDS